MIVSLFLSGCAGASCRPTVIPLLLVDHEETQGTNPIDKILRDHERKFDGLQLGFKCTY